MALISKHKSTPNQSTQYLSLQETTGVFGVLNPGGYGIDQTPTNYRKTADVLNSNFNIVNYNGSLSYTGSNTPVIIDELYSTSYNTPDAVGIANGTLKSFDLASLIGVNYVDAVYKSIYYNWFEGFDVCSMSSNEIILPSAAEAANVKYITFFDGVDVYTYTVLSVNGNSLQVNADLSTFVNTYLYKVAYESTVYFANTYNINKCLHFKISQLSLSTCSCKTASTEKLYEAVMMYMSIQPNMDLGKYTKAQEIIQALTIYCNGGECNC